ncbi:hypothetical protein SBRY_80010 [Actinacidiphila bryophytorum]|uniref:Uncharacterized protein n=1 Tax=Actinacidiphila bryophytorum TaxID=1436133 RepID=A0A9W4MKW2_9ACTN|nr:hypothetical protein SBRY_80010 [Actinacidiphila bryophytorum]
MLLERGAGLPARSFGFRRRGAALHRGVTRGAAVGGDAPLRASGQAHIRHRRRTPGVVASVARMRRFVVVMRPSKPDIPPGSEIRATCSLCGHTVPWERGRSGRGGVPDRRPDGP